MRVIYDKTKDNTIVSINTPTVLETVDNTDILVNIEDVTSVLHTGITGPAGPIAGITENTETLPFIGSGTGASKTTTKIVGNLIFESFGNGDELYINWIIPEDIDRTKLQTFHGHIFSETSEVGTLSSWEIHITSEDHDGTKFSDTLYATDLSLSDTAYYGVHAEVDFPAGIYVTPTTIALHYRLKRIASSNDPSNGVGVINVHMVYLSDGRVGEQGLDGAPGGEDEVALEKRTDFITDDEMYRGDAQPGTLDSANAWRIRKITISAVDGDVREMWADGDANYDKVWNNRLSYTYT